MELVGLVKLVGLMELNEPIKVICLVKLSGIMESIELIMLTRSGGVSWSREVSWSRGFS